MSAFSFVAPSAMYDADMQPINQSINQSIIPPNNTLQINPPNHTSNLFMRTSINQSINPSLLPPNNIRQQAEEEFPVFQLVDANHQSNNQSNPIQIDLTQPTSPRSFSVLSTTNQLVSPSTNHLSSLPSNRLNRRSPDASNSQSSDPPSAFVAYRRADRTRPATDQSQNERYSLLNSFFNSRTQPARQLPSSIQSGSDFDSLYEPITWDSPDFPIGNQLSNRTNTSTRGLAQATTAYPQARRTTSIIQSTRDTSGTDSDPFTSVPALAASQATSPNGTQIHLQFLSRTLAALDRDGSEPFLATAQSSIQTALAVASASQSSSQPTNQSAQLSDDCGYDPSLFVEPPAESKELEELTCVICSCIVRQPLNLPCGDLFCRSCLTQAFSQSTQSRRPPCCPACKQQFVLDDCQPNYTVIKKIWGMKMCCPHVADGCKSTFVIGVDDRNLIAHLAKCDYVNANCPFCEETMKKHQLIPHINNNMAQHMLKLQTKLKSATSTIENLQQTNSRLQSKFRSEQQQRDAMKEDWHRKFKKHKESLHNTINQVVDRRMAQLKQDLSEQSIAQPVNHSNMFLWKFRDVSLAGSAPVTWSSSRFVLHGRAFMLQLNKCRKGAVMTLSLSLGDVGPVDALSQPSSNEEKHNESTSSSSINRSDPLALTQSRVMQRMIPPYQVIPANGLRRGYEGNEHSSRFSIDDIPTSQTSNQSTNQSDSFVVQFYVFNTSSPTQSRSPLPVIVHTSQSVLHVTSQRRNTSADPSDDEPMSEFLSCCSSEVVNAADSEGDGQAGWIDQIHAESVTAAIRISPIKHTIKQSNQDTCLTQNDYFVACKLHDSERRNESINQSISQSLIRVDPSIFAPSTPEGATKRRRLEESTDMARR